MSGIVIKSDLKVIHRNRENQQQAPAKQGISNSERPETKSESEFKVPLPPTKANKYCLFLPADQKEQLSKKQLLVKRSSMELDCSGI
jgi:hypothetical protein